MTSKNIKIVRQPNKWARKLLEAKCIEKNQEIKKAGVKDTITFLVTKGALNAVAIPPNAVRILALRDKEYIYLSLDREDFSIRLDFKDNKNSLSKTKINTKEKIIFLTIPQEIVDYLGLRELDLLKFKIDAIEGKVSLVPWKLTSAYVSERQGTREASRNPPNSAVTEIMHKLT
jgi:bifunctional DNA-binding transcriptional regulator/antitoxin component of YhaV-PrlF toxin-antitoxin module